MKKYIKYVVLALCLAIFSVNVAEAQKKKGKGAPRAMNKRGGTKKGAKGQKKVKVINAGTVTDPVAQAAAPPAPAADSLPIPVIKKSLRPDEAVETSSLKDRTPLPYEHLRAEDALFRHKIWREIDTREKLNLPFRYSADENNGNQRFISILLKAIQDKEVTVFNSIDDRFTTPMTIGEVATTIGGDTIQVPIIDSLGVTTGYKTMRNEINLDSFYKFRIKEEVIFDKESSRLFWRILGIAPLKRLITQSGVDLGETELFWVYYPDMRPVFAKYEIYNGKNFGARMSWEELFESRMFYGRIIKSTIDNPYDRFIKNYPGLTDYPILQLLEGENIKEKIFNYEQDLWSY
jgi:gliding motility associated protien GldN